MGSRGATVNAARIRPTKTRYLRDRIHAAVAMDSAGQLPPSATAASWDLSLTVLRALRALKEPKMSGICKLRQFRIMVVVCKRIANSFSDSKSVVCMLQGL